MLGSGLVAVAETVGVVAALLAMAGALAAFVLVAFAQLRRLDRFTDEFMADREQRRRRTPKANRKTRSRSRRAA